MDCVCTMPDALLLQELRYGGECPGDALAACGDEYSPVHWTNTGPEAVPLYYIQSSASETEAEGAFTLTWRAGPMAMFEGCFQSAASEPIRACACHETCKTCGYSVWPDSVDQCLTCYEGTTHRASKSDGTGYCGGRLGHMVHQQFDETCFCQDF